MNARQRGLIIFFVLLVVGVIFCGYVPFVFMPNNGAGVALPIIEVPGEVVVEDFLFGVDLTNTLIGTVLTDIILILFVFLAWRASKGWTREVPGRFQSLVETMVEGFYGFCRGIGGDRLRTAPFLWPLVATIFFFLLAANWMKLLPGVETVGKMHCAHVGQSGYPMIEGWTDSSYRLWNDTPLNAGESQTEEAEHYCHEFFVGEWERYPVETAEEIEPQLAEAEAHLTEVQLEVAPILGAEEAAAEGEGEEAAESEEVAETEGEEGEEAEVMSVEEAETELTHAEHAVHRQELRLAAVLAIPELTEAREGLVAYIDEQHGEEVEEPAPSNIFGILRNAAESDEESETLADLQADLESAIVSAETAVDEEEHLTALEDEVLPALDEVLNYHRTQLEFPTATLVFDEEQLNETEAVPFIFHITPFVRGPATDLSLAFALAIMSMVMVQVYGVMAQGALYFEKFINVSALGNLNKKPMGAIDFVVGLIEIISEIGKVVSLAFRLFGNLFAGGVALMALSFLVAMIVPVAIYGLEVVIGTVQALVFAVLTLVFSVQAMEAHHGDEEHGEEGHH